MRKLTEKLYEDQINALYEVTAMSKDKAVESSPVSRDVKATRRRSGIPYFPPGHEPDFRRQTSNDSSQSSPLEQVFSNGTNVDELKHARRRSAICYFPPNHEAAVREVMNGRHSRTNTSTDVAEDVSPIVKESQPLVPVQVFGCEADAFCPRFARLLCQALTPQRA